MWQIYHGKCNVIQVAGKRGCPFSAEDNLCRTTSFDARWPLAEDNLWQKTTFDPRRPLTEHNLQHKTTFNGIRPSMEGNLYRKATCNGRQPSTEYTFNGWWPSMKDKFLKISRFCSAINRRCGNFFDVHYRFWNFSASTFSNSQACAESKTAIFFVLE